MKLASPLPESPCRLKGKRWQAHQVLLIELPPLSHGPVPSRLRRRRGSRMQLKRVKVRKRRRKRGRRKQHVHPGRQNLVCSGHSRHAEANQLVQIPQAAAPVSVSHTPVFARLLCALESLVPSTAAIEVDPTRSFSLPFCLVVRRREGIRGSRRSKEGSDSSFCQP